jgi:N-acetylmuramoyl-L-alanine amidase
MKDETKISRVKTVTPKIDLKVRKEPHDQSSLLGIAPAGIELAVLGERQKWFKVIFSDTIGWVFKEYVNIKALEKYKVFIDPGHGGKDPGAMGPRGTREKDLTLTLSQYLKEELEMTGKFHVQLSRAEDRFVDLKDRGRAALKWGADIFISQHLNAAENRAARGVEVFYSAALPKTKDKAAELAREVARVLKTKNRGAKVQKLTVLKVTQEGGIPLVFLVENGFISNAPEEGLLRQDKMLREIAKVQSQVISNWQLI